MNNWILDRYKKLNNDFEFTECQLKQSFRINPLLSNEKEVLNSLKKQKVILEKIPFLDKAYWYEAPFSLASSPEYLMGKIYIQEAASQLPPLVLLKTWTKNSKILDMCAAPGSKTTQMAEITNDEIPIVALDSNQQRLQPLKNNIERLKLKSIVTYRKDSRFAHDLEIKFTHILLDAPCSGNYCVEKNFFTLRSIDGILERSKLQKELLRAAYKSLDKKGILVYSTCSLEPEEDELMIEWFIQTYPDMKLIDTELTIGDEGLTKVFETTLNSSLKLTRRFWPYKTETEGFFIAKLQKQN
ncbi:MAG: RsmB/NOP family class I SAM-dependent RNA methyltransferase [Candidatus Nanoarchaeia archaeon]|jgi:tRNA (cytosine40_48-C5)-methyltransferase|nr:RsmB/NOP family class I SAM-dependent RNA methyltransferase [Candidatus Nanoarchaeia archaeon]